MIFLRTYRLNICLSLAVLALLPAFLSLVPTAKYYDRPEFLINILPLFDEVPQSMSLQDSSNMVIWSSKGFVVTSGRHLLPVGTHRFPGLQLVAEIPGSDDLFLTTSVNSAYKLMRVNYLTGEVYVSTTLTENPKKILAHPTLGVATLDTTKISFFSAGLESARSPITFTSGEVIDFLFFPSDDKIFALKASALLKYSFNTPADPPTTLPVTLTGLTCKRLHDETVYKGFFYIDGTDSNNKYFMIKFNKVLDIEDNRSLAITDGYRHFLQMGNSNTAFHLIDSATTTVIIDKRRLKYTKEGFPNQNYGPNMILTQATSLSSSMLTINKDTKECMDYNSLDSYSNNYYHWFYGYKREIWSPKILVKGLGERHYYFYYQSAANGGNHKILTDLSGKTKGSSVPNLPSECLEIVPLPIKNSYLAFFSDRVIVNKDGSETTLLVSYPAEKPIVSHFNKAKKSIYLTSISGGRDLITINWGGSPPTLSIQATSVLTRNLAVLNDESGFVSASPDKRSINFFSPDGSAVIATIATGVAADIVKISTPVYPGASQKQIAVLFKDNTMRFYFTKSRTLSAVYDFSQKTSVGVLDFEFYPQEPKFAIFFLKNTGQDGVVNSNLEIWDYHGQSLVESIDNYPFSEGRFFVNRFSLNFIGKSIIYHFLNFDQKCLGGQTNDDNQKLCVPDCPPSRPFRVLSSGNCVAVCPSGTSQAASDSYKQMFGSNVCYDSRVTVPSNNCELWFGGKCIKCAANYLRSSTSTGFLNSCIRKDLCTCADTIPNVQTEDISGFGICHKYNTFQYCAESSNGECTKCLPNFLRSRVPYDTSITKTILCVPCVVTFMDEVGDDMHYIFPSDFIGDGSDVCTFKSFASTAVQKCFFYQYKGCAFTTDPAVVLFDSNNDGFFEASTCPASTAFTAGGICNPISRVVPKCNSYNSATNCASCDSSTFPHSRFLDGTNDICLPCELTCPCSLNCQKDKCYV